MISQNKFLPRFIFSMKVHDQTIHGVEKSLKKKLAEVFADNFACQKLAT
jgi:hypothetical protein